MAICVVSLLIALSQGQDEGWDSRYILSLFTIAGITFFLFLLIEYTVRDPVVDITLYKNVVYVGATFVGILLGLGLFSSMFLVPLFIQDMLEYTAFQTGLLMLPGALATGVILPFAGKLSDRINPRFLVSVGFLSSALSLYLFSQMHLQTEASAIVVALAIRAGMGFIFPPLLNLSLRTFPREKISAASGLFNITRQVAGMCGIAIAGIMLERWQYFTHTYFAGEMGVSLARTQETLTDLSLFLRDAGEIGQILQLKSMGMLQRALNQESLLVAFQNSFFLLALVFLIAALATFLIPTEGKKATG
jgi:DHA2 family multidrug resistance protein